MSNERFFSLSFDEQYRIKKVSLDYYLNAITVLFCTTTTIWTTKEKEGRNEKERETDRREYSLVAPMIA
jgi:hypothetical protein